MAPEEIRVEIERACGRDWEIDLAPLLERLRKSNPTATFHALFQLAVHSQTHGPAAPAALLLRRLNPSCPIPCQQAIQAMLTDWDVSIEEVPFYLAAQFGTDQTKAAVAELRSENTESTQSKLLDAVEYWLDCYEKMAARRLPDRSA
jgi:hypothetical protein